MNIALYLLFQNDYHVIILSFSPLCTLKIVHVKICILSTPENEENIYTIIMILSFSRLLSKRLAKQRMRKKCI
jgi:hypothetical protein